MLTITVRFMYWSGMPLIWIQNGMKLSIAMSIRGVQRWRTSIRSAYAHGPLLITVSIASSDGKTNWNRLCSMILPRTKPSKHQDRGIEATIARRFCFLGITGRPIRMNRFSSSACLTTSAGKTKGSSSAPRLISCRDLQMFSAIE